MSESVSPDVNEAWAGEAARTAEILATLDPWLIWRRAMNVATYPMRDRSLSAMEQHHAEASAAHAVFEAGYRSAALPEGVSASDD